MSEPKAPSSEPPGEQHVDALTELAGVVLRQTDLTSTLGEICRIATRAVPKAVAASVTTLKQGRPEALASDEWGQRLDELQYVEHEGPCLDAYRTGNVFRVADLLEESRWPAYAKRAVEEGARSMLSIPMSAEGKLIGALNLYSREPEAFDPSEVAAAFFGHRDLAQNLADAMGSRAVIEQAKGVVIAREHSDADQAFKILIEMSSREHRKLRDVANDLVTEAASQKS